MLFAAVLLSIAAAPAPTPSPVAYVTHVGVVRGRCVYRTGDVLMTASQFEDDLRDRFARPANLIVYHDPNVPPSCLATAMDIARRVGFETVRAEIAPPDLDMGPPR